MLLLIDVGNSNTVLGVMGGGEVQHSWRVSTLRRTTDEFGVVMTQLLASRGWSARDVRGVIVCCVVPSALYSITKAARRYLDREALVVGSGIRTGLKLRVDNPREVGADRIVNSVAAVERFGAPIVIVSFGAATTFDCVDRKGQYVGGAIAPGLDISAEALSTRTARLPRVEVARPRRAIGTNTIHSIQSGLYHGYVGLVNHLARSCKEELGAGVRCVATGGFSNLIGRGCDEIDEIDELMTLRGLGLIWDRNQR